ncbi:hypothetical protein HZA56_07735 [Candidatus Poribacteria bacterium]|nr:hypothetical protein [Candidatus Poribacteria bacterium]
MNKKAQNTIRASVGMMVGAPVAFSFLTGGSFAMNAEHAFTFAVAVSLFSIAVIAGTALMGAYRFLKNVGVFKGHYYY